MATASTDAIVIRQDCHDGLYRCKKSGAHAHNQSGEAVLESLKEILHEVLEFNRQDELEAAWPGAEELGFTLLRVGICFVTSGVMAMKSCGRVAITHCGGIHHRIFVATLRAN
jgi:hypothetical protein